MSTPRIIEMVATALRDGGFGGLVVPGECGCQLGDLSPAGCLTAECRAGYKHVHSETGEWMISAQRDGVDDDDVQRVIDMCG